jgi:acetoin utilization protein AcuB
MGRSLLVRDLMQREVVTLDQSETLGLADDIMRLGRIRHMPVMSDGRLVGILSQRDLFRAAVSSVLRFKTTDEREWLATVPVSEAMARQVVTAAPETPVRNAVELMAEKKIGCLPVVEEGRLVGLLSESDCLRLLARLLGDAESGE